jgi:hypothetical protein
MRKLLIAAAALALGASPVLAAKGTLHISGQGTIEAGRTFVVNARIEPDGTVSGQATLINRNFSGTSGKGPYTAHFDITCANKIGDTIFFGGSTTRTNDSGLIDAAYFSVQDDGKSDRISRVFFFDDNPATMGDPGLCQGNQLGDFPMEEVEQGNINVH